jgi:hypothetical protein
MTSGVAMSVESQRSADDVARVEAVARRQRWQDFLFHKVTMVFSLLVLAALTGIIISLFFFFNTFAVNQALQYHRVGGWKDYLRGERMYITLSLVAKTVLAYQVFAGAIIPALTA